MEDASGLMPLFSLVVTSECVWAGKRKGPGCVSVAAAHWVGETSDEGGSIFLGGRSPRDLPAGSRPSLTGNKEENDFPADQEAIESF